MYMYMNDYTSVAAPSAEKATHDFAAEALSKQLAEDNPELTF